MRQPLAVACALLAPPFQVAAQRTLPALPVFEGRAIALAPAQSEGASRGEPAVLLLETQDARVVAVFGLVAVNAPRRALVERLAALERSLRVPEFRSLGLFRSPAAPANVQAFTVSARDVSALRACRTGACEFKLPASEMARAKAILDSGVDGPSRLGTYARRRAAEYVNDYRERGNAAMVVYDDFGAGGVRASDAFAALMSATPWLAQHAPVLQRYLLQYPRGRPPGVSDAIYWTVEAMPGLRSTLTINHRVVFSPPERPNTSVVATKQIFADHYFEGAFDLVVATDRADGPRGDGTWLMVLRQYRFDHLPGGILKIREKARAASRDRLYAELRRMRE
jgi:hypothetical protein